MELQGDKFSNLNQRMIVRAKKHRISVRNIVSGRRDLGGPSQVLGHLDQMFTICCKPQLDQNHGIGSLLLKLGPRLDYYPLLKSFNFSS
jgi:hypothetical protein